MREINATLREAQSRWARMPIRERLRVVRELRYRIAENAEALADAAGSVSGRPRAEKLVSDVLPLADACRWLEREAARVVAARRFGKRGRPMWLHGHSFEVQRQPFGVVLVIGPANNPLFLPGVHSLHALVAGNAVLLKPAPGMRHVAFAFARLAFEAGLDPDLLTIMPDAIEATHQAIEAGVDKIIFTGSSENGRDLLARLAATNTPAVMELSGEDAVIVLADADLDLVARALRFGARLNAGQTCIAPRRLIVVESVAEELAEHLGSARDPRDRADDSPACLRRSASPAKDKLAESPNSARELHALPGEIERVRDECAVVEAVNTADFSLGASIFSRDVSKARALAARLKTGFVTINDLIVPIADPRMPFGGVKASGFGTTRGAEGLLEMTFPHVVAVRRGRMRPHFDQPGPNEAQLFSAWLRAAHGRHRLAAIPRFIRSLIENLGNRKPTL